MENNSRKNSTNKTFLFQSLITTYGPFSSGPRKEITENLWALIFAPPSNSYTRFSFSRLSDDYLRAEGEANKTRQGVCLRRNWRSITVEKRTRSSRLYPAVGLGRGEWAINRRGTVANSMTAELTDEQTVSSRSGYNGGECYVRRWKKKKKKKRDSTTRMND